MWELIPQALFEFVTLGKPLLVLAVKISCKLSLRCRWYTRQRWCKFNPEQSTFSAVGLLHTPEYTSTSSDGRFAAFSLLYAWFSNTADIERVCL